MSCFSAPHLPHACAQFPLSSAFVEPRPAPAMMRDATTGAGPAVARPAAVEGRGHIIFEIEEEVQGRPPPAIFVIEDELPVTTGRGDSFSIGEVGVQVGTVPIQPPLVNPNNPGFQQVIRNTTPSKFTGRVQDWTTFFKDWELYLRTLSVCGTNLIKK